MAGSSVSSVSLWLAKVATCCRPARCTVPPTMPSDVWALTSLLMLATSPCVAFMRCSMTVFSFVWTTTALFALSMKGCMAAPSPWIASMALRPSVEMLESVFMLSLKRSALLFAAVSAPCNSLTLLDTSTTVFLPSTLSSTRILILLLAITSRSINYFLKINNQCNTFQLFQVYLLKIKNTSI